ncbi:HAAS signaling domain-containing protein [Micromonospora musae]|uniref:HAAS signaling domain-containing protein n=1 Tax=Micromonospora musae TaxID=1894970 RepID=UPI00340BA761
MTVREQEIAEYVARVRAALADLPPALREELTEDLPEHLTEVAAEGEGALVDRLGTPEAYAAELRDAAGAPDLKRRKLDQRVAGLVTGALGRLRALDRRLGPPLGYPSGSDFLRLLRPGWWVLRAYLAAMLVTVVTTGGSLGLLPRFGGELLAGVVMLIGFLFGSIWLGRRSERLRRWPRLALHASSIVLVVFGLAGLADGERRAGYGGYDPIAVVNPYDQVRDVFVYDSEGRLVQNARLFDQNGNPIRLGYPDCLDEFDPQGGTQPGNPLLRPYPYCPDQAPFAPRAPVGGAPAPVLPPLSSPSATAAASPTTTPEASSTSGPSTTPGASSTPEPTATADPGGTASVTPTPSVTG